MAVTQVQPRRGILIAIRTASPNLSESPRNSSFKSSMKNTLHSCLHSLPQGTPADTPLRCLVSFAGASSSQMVTSMFETGSRRNIHGRMRGFQLEREATVACPLAAPSHGRKRQPFLLSAHSLDLQTWAFLGSLSCSLGGRPATETHNNI